MRYRTAAICTGLFASGAAFANNGDQMVGYSAITNAVGGAVVAAPLDVTTSLTNPAGLGFLPLGERGTRFDMTVALLNPNRSMNGVESDSDVYVMATGGFAFQSEIIGPDLIVGVGAYPISGGGVDFPASAFRLGTANAAIVANRMSMRIGPAAAYKINDRWSVGANLSLSLNQMSMKNMTLVPGRPPTVLSDNFPNDVAYGVSFVLGTMYRLSERTNVGFSYTSKSYTEDLEWNMDDGKWRLKFEDPQALAIGVSHRLTDRLLLSADLKWLNFSDVRDTATLYGPTGAQDKLIAYSWDDQTVIALGAKYDLSDRLSFMAGYNYGASPIAEEDINNNAGVTAIVEHHLSAGMTAKVSSHSALTVSLIHGFKNDMTASVGLPTAVSFETNLLSLQFTYTD
ncbi:MAG TPA: outer membrane protein transport protein [Thiobacillaceae bacterium]|nr:outer membrane protein transport protein [Thiobacillaceae bacterium]